MDDIYMEVDYNEYCYTCKHFEKKGHEDPCNECLDHPMNVQTRRPVCWEEKED